jgi:hypothetical protein
MCCVYRPFPSNHQLERDNRTAPAGRICTGTAWEGPPRFGTEENTSITHPARRPSCMLAPLPSGRETYAPGIAVSWPRNVEIDIDIPYACTYVRMYVCMYRWMDGDVGMCTSIHRTTTPRRTVAARGVVFLPLSPLNLK